MATVGTLDVNLTRYGNMTDQAARFGEGITTGVADQGSLLGTVLGIVMAIGALLLLIGAVFGIILYVVAKAKSTKDGVSRKM